MNDKFTPQDHVLVAGQKHKVEEFSDISLLPLLVLIHNGARSSLSIRSNAAEEIKEVIVPTIPNSIIYSNLNGVYVSKLGSQETGKLLRELILIYYQKERKRLMSIPEYSGIATDLEEVNRMIESLYAELNSDLVSEPTTTEASDVLDTIISSDKEETALQKKQRLEAELQLLSVVSEKQE